MYSANYRGASSSLQIPLSQRLDKSRRTRWAWSAWGMGGGVGQRHFLIRFITMNCCHRVRARERSSLLRHACLGTVNSPPARGGRRLVRRIGVIPPEVLPLLPPVHGASGGQKGGAHGCTGSRRQPGRSSPPCLDMHLPVLTSLHGQRHLLSRGGRIFGCRHKWGLGCSSGGSSCRSSYRSSGGGGVAVLHAPASAPYFSVRVRPPP